MSRNVPYIVGLIAVVVSVDLLFLRHSPDRLIVNIGIVLVFAAWRFLARP